MSLTRRRAVLGFAAVLATVAVTGASGEFDALASGEVVVYLATDGATARPVIEAFEKRTGTTVRVVAHDAASTEALSKRVRDAKADVVWSIEPMRAIALAHEGLLARHDTPTAKARDAQWIGRESRWHGFGARLGGFLVSTADMPEQPKDEFSRDRWQFRHAYAPNFSFGMFVIGRPESGDSLAHLTMAHTMWGQGHFQTWCFQARRQDMRVLPSDEEAALAVVRREAGAGLVDSLHASRARSGSKDWGAKAEFIAVEHEISVSMERPPEFGGVMVIPQVVGVVESGANRANAARFVDYVLSADAERLLLQAGGDAFVPLHREHAGEFRSRVPGHVAVVNLDEAAAKVPDTLRIFRRAFPE